MSTNKKNEEIIEESAEQGVEETDAAVEEQQAVENEVCSVDELETAKAQAAENHDKLMRLAAEFENYKKRMERERSNALKYAGEPILREILPVVDNLERAIDHIEGADAQKSLDGLVEGVNLTLKGVLATLEKLEVTPITSIGEPFDPNMHDALTMEASEEIPSNHVLREFEKGYRYKDRLLRVAKVIVSAGKSNG